MLFPDVQIVFSRTRLCSAGKLRQRVGVTGSIAAAPTTPRKIWHASREREYVAEMAWKSVLEDHPDHARLIGMIAIESGNLELALASLFARMLLIPLRVGRAVYLTPQGFQARLDILRNAAKAEFDRAVRPAVLRKRYPEVLRRVTDIIKRANDAVNKRNRVVHDSWGYNDDDKEVSRLVIDGKPDRESASVSIKELADQLVSIRVLIDDVGALAREFYRHPPTMIDLRLSETPQETPDKPIRRRWPQADSPKTTHERRQPSPK
jgi:hypothetical protein